MFFTHGVPIFLQINIDAMYTRDVWQNTYKGWDF